MFLKILTFVFLSTSLFANRDHAATLEVIKYLFETKYAPLYFKEQTLGFNLNQSIYGLKQSISFSQNPQRLLRKFFLELSDYHLSVTFHSTSFASLPFTVKKIDEELYVKWVDQNDCDLKVGDKILYWDGIYAPTVFNQFKLLEMTGSHELYSTDAVSELYFTSRIGEFGMEIPHGNVQITYVDGETLELKHTCVPWYFEREVFPYTEIPTPKPFSLVIEPEKNPLLEKQSFFLTKEPLSKAKLGLELPNYFMGSKRGYLPILGEITSNFKKGPFHYYIYTSPNGNNVGFLRLGSLQFDRAELVQLKKILNYFEKNTDGLVLDITHNPGGLILNMFALISYLIDFPIQNYEQTEILTSEEIELAVELKLRLENYTDEKEALKIIKRESQYNPTLTLTKQLLNYSDFLLSSWENGEHITALYPILGIDEIHPDHSCNYSKPLLILTDNLSFSCGDFLPGILQECGRAKIMGQQTGGAGGCVAQSAQFPNPLGIKSMIFTSSLVYKNNGDWIENKGIEPDFLYHITAHDIQNNYVDYMNAINEQIDELCEWNY